MEDKHQIEGTPHTAEAREQRLVIGDDDNVMAAWPRGLPRSPSMKGIDSNEEDMEDNEIPTCVVFNANTAEGATLVRILSERGFRVVAVVRVYVGKKTQELIKLKRVVVKVADRDDQGALFKAAQGCSRAFLVTRYWERFDSVFEERTAFNVLAAVSKAGIKHFVMVCLEDAVQLKSLGLKSQLKPGHSGLIVPSFDGMKAIHDKAEECGVSIAHLMTSYFNLEGARKSLILVRGPKGKIIVQSHFEDPINHTYPQN